MFMSYILGNVTPDVCVLVGFPPFPKMYISLLQRKELRFVRRGRIEERERARGGGGYMVSVIDGRHWPHWNNIQNKIRQGRLRAKKMLSIFSLFSLSLLYLTS